MIIQDPCVLVKVLVKPKLLLSERKKYKIVISFRKKEYGVRCLDFLPHKTHLNLSYPNMKDVFFTINGQYKPNGSIVGHKPRALNI